MVGEDLVYSLFATPLIVFGACLWPPKVVPKEADIGGLARTIGAGTSNILASHFLHFLTQLLVVCF